MMDVRYDTRDIVLQAENLNMIEMEKAYLKQFDGAIVKYVSNEEGDKLVISMSE